MEPFNAKTQAALELCCGHCNDQRKLTTSSQFAMVYQKHKLGDSMWIMWIWARGKANRLWSPSVAIKIRVVEKITLRPWSCNLSKSLERGQDGMVLVLTLHFQVMASSKEHQDNTGSLEDSHFTIKIIASCIDTLNVCQIALAQVWWSKSMGRWVHNCGQVDGESVQTLAIGGIESASIEQMQMPGHNAMHEVKVSATKTWRTRSHCWVWWMHWKTTMQWDCKKPSGNKWVFDATMRTIPAQKGQLHGRC